MLALEDLGESRGSERRALIGVEDLRPDMRAQGLLQAIEAKYHLDAVADPPTQHLAPRPVDDRHR